MSRRPGLCLVVVLLLAACSRTLAPQRSRPAEAALPILLDLDMGLDDARVLLALPAQRRYRPVLVTTVEGSASAAVGAVNARRLLTAVGLDSVPVARGAPRALRRAVPPPPWRTLSEQLGGVELPAPRGPVESDAPRAIARALRAHVGVRVLALGPLTNLALALELEPELARRIPSLYLLGDFERCDCYNCTTDPDAARMVLASGIPTYMVVRAATEALPFDRAFLARVHALPGKAARLVDRIMARHAGAPELRLWDDAVLVSLLDPDAVPYRRSAGGPFRAERLDPERVRRLLLRLWAAR